MRYRNFGVLSRKMEIIKGGTAGDIAMEDFA